MLFGFFGVKALLFVGGAMAIALVTGFIFTLLDQFDLIEGPAKDVMEYMGPDLKGMLVVLLFATILEVCSEGTSPLAFEIFNKTAALGNPFVFLLAGVATDYTEIGLLWTNIGKRTAIWLPVVTVPQILLLGMWFNQLS